MTAWIKDNIFHIIALLGVAITLYSRIIVLEQKALANEKDHESLHMVLQEMRSDLKDIDKKTDDIYLVIIGKENIR